MDVDRAGRGTRRELLTGALGTGALIAGAAVAWPDRALGDQIPTTDAGLLSAALGAEQVAARAYRRVLRLPGLSPHARRMLRELLTHVRAHARELRAELRARGVTPPPPPTSDAQVDQTLSDHGMSSDLASLSTVKDGLQILLDVEALCEGAYYTAIEKLSDPAATVRLAQALASEAQHSTLLSGLLHPGDISQSVPDWYVGGVT